MPGDKKIEKAEYAKHQLAEEKKKAEKEEKSRAEDKKGEATPPAEKVSKEKPRGIAKKGAAPKPEGKKDGKGAKPEAKKEGEGAKPEGKKKGKGAKPEEEEKKILKESVHTIPLRKAFDKPRKLRAKYAAREVKDYILKHTRKEPVVGPSVNEALWAKGITSPPRRIKVRIQEEKDRATAVIA